MDRKELVGRLLGIVDTVKHKDELMASSPMTFGKPGCLAQRLMAAPEWSKEDYHPETGIAGVPLSYLTRINDDYAFGRISYGDLREKIRALEHAQFGTPAGAHLQPELVQKPELVTA